MDENEILVNQYKLLEERRNYFGRLFWQMPGLLLAVIALVFSGVIDKALHIVRFTCLGAGAAMSLMTYIAYRFRASQDDLEKRISLVEKKLLQRFPEIVELPKSYGPWGARNLTVYMLGLFSAILLLGAVFL